MNSDDNNNININNNNKDNDNNVCLRCNYQTIVNIQVCHTKCFNCGYEQDCSDKGSVW